MKNTHLIHFAEQRIEIVNDIVIQDRSELEGFPTYMRAGGEIHEGMPVFMERGMRFKLEEGELLSWKMGTVAFDLTGLGRFGECMARVRNTTTGKVETWPFTMLYLKNNGTTK